MPGTLDNDPYGVDLAMGPTGDLAVWANGGLATLDGPQNVAQALTLRLRTTVGELPLHPAYGSQISVDLIGTKNINAAAVADALDSQLPQIVRDDPRILSGRVTQASTTGDTQQAFGIELQLAGGERLQIADLQEPRANEVAVPNWDDSDGFTLDTIDEAEFFADEPEYDQLADVDQLAAIADSLQGT